MHIQTIVKRGGKWEVGEAAIIMDAVHADILWFDYRVRACGEIICASAHQGVELGDGYRGCHTDQAHIIRKKQNDHNDAGKIAKNDDHRQDGSPLIPESTAPFLPFPLGAEGSHIQSG